MHFHLFYALFFAYMHHSGNLPSFLYSRCILNRILAILNKDLSEVKDEKTKKELIEAKRIIKQKYCVEKEVEITEEQNESAEAFYKAMGIM